MVCTVDHLASGAGLSMLTAGGNAVDAAIAASAALAVTTQHMCGMGGDLWALVHEPGAAPTALNASGRAGSGSDAAAMRAEGLAAMPFRGDIRSVPVPGCVDGWTALHERYGSLPLEQLLAPATELAELGFPASPLLGTMSRLVADVDGAHDYVIDGKPVATGQMVRRHGIARSLRSIASEGRSGWYEGEFGEELIERGRGLYSPDDLARSQADWVTPTSVEAWGHQLWTVPPNSQGYLSLAGAVIANGLDLPDDPGDPLWAHLLIEAAKQAGFDRAASLFEGADGAALVSESRLAPRRAAIDPNTASSLVPPAAGGGTIYLCTTDRNRMGVSLMQSNAAGFGSHVALPGIGVFLHNRGIGFSLEEGHPAELAPGRRPPSTLAPALVTNTAGSLRSVLGTMGGDGQPQVVLQMLARMLQLGQGPGTNLSSPRFTLTVPDAIGFDTWSNPASLTVSIEAGSGWRDGLESRGHRVTETAYGLGLYGHAHAIEVVDNGDGTTHLAGMADPRALIGAAIGH